MLRTEGSARPLHAALQRIEERVGGVHLHTGEDKEALRYWIEEDVLARKQERHGTKVLTRHLAQVFSQNFEDAIIAEIYSRIGADGSTFVEIGVEDGVECNTRFLMAQGWRGLWIETDQAAVRRIQERFGREIDSGQLTVRAAHLTPDNTAGVLDEAGFGDAVDFVSVDVDMHTHHIWRALRTRARVACIEYNASFPPTLDFGVPYEAGEGWDGSNWFGASLKTLEHIGREKGMSLVGCDTNGVNAFFVRDELLGEHFLAPFDAETHFEPARYCLVKSRGHKRRQ